MGGIALCGDKFSMSKKFLKSLNYFLFWILRPKRITIFTNRQRVRFFFTRFPNLPFVLKQLPLFMPKQE
ncbi:unnamed protein product [Paramecium pentaurelia]|uniref:Uncharacterized protein n=1 Tax=Paramecium pentaurelia TaxID=43138 RepID=A0A8S1WPV1_9CILI|nr:unnamed protein product [Paramecium pentaurelia]